MGRDHDAGHAVCDRSVLLRLRRPDASERADGGHAARRNDRRARRGARRGGRRRDRRFRHVGGGAESGYFAAPARPSAPVRRAGQHDPRDGYGGLFRRLPHDLGEKSFGHQKPDRDGEPDGKCTASERAPELLHRGQIPRRTGLLRENARQSGAGRAAAG